MYRNPDPARNDVLAARAQLMEEEGGPPIELPAHDEGEEVGDPILYEKGEVAVRNHQEGED